MNLINRIDSHQHFWNYSAESHSWMDESMLRIQRDFLPKDLKPLLEATGFGGCVAVQASQSESENDFLLSFAEQNDFIKGIVGWIDLQSKDLTDRLHYYSQHPKIKGFRHIIQDEPDLDFMLRPTFLHGISKLQEFGFTYDILIYPQHLPNAYTLAKSIPNQLFVIDHLAKPNIKGPEVEFWRKGLEKIASLENVHCKISGMVTEADWKSWEKEQFEPYIATALATFGIDRLMYGSDWPVCTLSATYKDAYWIVEDFFSSFSKSEQNKLFGSNASSFYKL
ncbi:amidohydrolase family protein [Aquiflexum sp. TKW24L]|uniref:amidohydrolase family protein n=1 Tax=Aquiflexum sp. TKW24L TaxID=2942212 RepID=UPI0020BDA3A9|nr:amidohydrolase family protein [Aquiflexum sp. TKW24L]MCL6258111.1 amidohydrolase family protein [Aquiflexum sp. TKW24L]